MLAVSSVVVRNARLERFDRSTALSAGGGTTAVTVVLEADQATYKSRGFLIGVFHFILP